MNNQNLVSALLDKLTKTETSIDKLLVMFHPSATSVLEEETLRQIKDLDHFDPRDLIQLHQTVCENINCTPDENTLTEVSNIINTHFK